MEYLGFILLFVIAALFNPSDLKRFIHNGENAQQGQFPFMVSIQKLYPDRKHICGGSIIDTRWVITAAHCMRESFYEIEAGNMELYFGIYYRVFRIVIHPNFEWDSGSVVNDIALMQIQENSFNFTVWWSIGIIKLYNKPFAPVGDNITAIGWGKNEYNSNPIRLQHTSKLRIAKCDNNYVGLDAQLICANHDPSITTCKGDSGGPAVYNGTLIGLVKNAGRPCNNGDQNRFTRIYYYKDWLLKIVPNNNWFK